MSFPLLCIAGIIFFFYLRIESPKLQYVPSEIISRSRFRPEIGRIVFVKDLMVATTRVSFVCFAYCREGVFHPISLMFGELSICQLTHVYAYVWPLAVLPSVFSNLSAFDPSALVYGKYIHQRVCECLLYGASTIKLLHFNDPYRNVNLTILLHCDYTISQKNSLNAVETFIRNFSKK